MADRLFLSAETRRILLQQLALRTHQVGGVILPYLLLNRLQAGLYRMLLSADRSQRRAQRVISTISA
jgi:hypothetical protein